MKIAPLRTFFLAAAVMALAAAPAMAQVHWDSSGNHLMNGTFHFREVIWITDFQGSNQLMQAVSQYGSITFDGNGNYHIVAQVFASDSNAVLNSQLDGTYTIAASGHGFITRANDFGGLVYGSYANGVFMGSSTESALNNLFIAVQDGATSASFAGAYTAAYINFPNLAKDQARDAQYQLTPNATGGLAPVNLSGFIGGNYTAVTQTINNATYSFANGTGTLDFGGQPGAGTLLAGSQQFYVSPDGEFIVGGSPQGWDLFVAVRAASNVQPNELDSLFYAAGVDVDRGASIPALDTYYGSFKGRGGDLVGHQRLLVAPDESSFDYTYSDVYALGSDGSHDDFLGYQLRLSNNRKFRVGYGAGDYLGISVGVAAPTLQGQGVFINPMGVLNGASFVPFTAGLARGTLVTLFGSGFADAGAQFVDATFPPTLGGVQVIINGLQAPIYVVTATQISIVIPYAGGIPERGIAEITVIRNGVTSNRVTFYVNRTSPGIFTMSQTGLGYAAALHADNRLVTSASPVAAGETVQLFLTGLGDVNPPVDAGSPGPVSPLSVITSPVGALISRLDARITYAGLAPNYGGLYQMNIEVPPGASAGNAFVELSGPDAFSSQVLLPIGNTAVANSARAAGQGGVRPVRQGRRRPLGAGGKAPARGASRTRVFPQEDR